VLTAREGVESNGGKKEQMCDVSCVMGCVMSDV